MEVFIIIIIFLYLGRTNTKGLAKFWGKMRDGPDGRRREKRLNTNCGYSDFVVSRKKKGFLLLFFIGYFFLLFDFIALLQPIHHCPI